MGRRREPQRANASADNIDRGTFWRAILQLVLVSVINLLTPLERGDGGYLEVRAGDGARKGAL